MKIQIILGSTRPNRLGDRVSKWVKSSLKNSDDVMYEFIDLRDWPLPFYDETKGPGGLKGNYKNTLGKKWAEKIDEADGYIVITPEYNHSYPAVLKNAFDYAYFEWFRKPVGFISYSDGEMGGARAVEHLRLIAVTLQMAPIQAAVHIPIADEAISEDGSLQNTTLQRKLDGFVEQLLWWTDTLKNAREKTTKS